MWPSINIRLEVLVITRTLTADFTRPNKVCKTKEEWQIDFIVCILNVDKEFMLLSHNIKRAEPNEPAAVRYDYEIRSHHFGERRVHYATFYQGSFANYEV